MSNESFVLVHGAWHGSWAWEPVTERLRRAGHVVVAVDLPSSGPDPMRLGSFDDDVAAVRAALDDVGGDAVVVGHSYGGQVISAERLQLQSLAAAMASLPAAGWHDLPSRYVLCEQDRAIPGGVQEVMSRHADEVHRLDSSHSPFLSQPDAVVALLLDG